MTIAAVIENYANGNLTDAREGAKRHSARALTDYIRSAYDYDTETAQTVADYLKDKRTFTAACKAQERAAEATERRAAYRAESNDLAQWNGEYAEAIR